jgi:hypothetical protein
MNQLQEIYLNFAISSFEKIEMTKLEKVLGKGYSHDRFTKMLLEKNRDYEKELWNSAKQFLRDYENEKDGCLVVDDTLLNKPYTKESDTVCYHFDHTVGRSVKGINLLNFLYTDKSGVSIPVAYEIITKSEKVKNKKSGKICRKAKVTKNEIFREKLEIITSENQLKYKYILADKWFSSNENMEFIENTLKKKFVIPLKRNRLVALNIEDKNRGNYVTISSIDTEDFSSRSLYLQGVEMPLKISKQGSKDGTDENSNYLYLASNDRDLTDEEILEIYKRRWKVEEYHKSLKQNLKIEHSPTKVETSQHNHIFLSVLGFIKLEKIKVNYKMNHFAIKEKIYIEALKEAYKKTLEFAV